MSQEDLVELGDAVVVVGQLVVAYVNGTGLFGEGAHAFHILSECAEPGSPEDVFGLVDKLAVVE